MQDLMTDQGPNAEIEELEVQIEEAKKIAAFGEAIERLLENKDFKTVFVEGYFKDEAVRLAHASMDMALSPDQRDNILTMIQSISVLKQFLNNSTTMAANMRQAMADAEQEIEAIREEQEFEGDIPDESDAAFGEGALN